MLVILLLLVTRIHNTGHTLAYYFNKSLNKLWQNYISWGGVKFYLLMKESGILNYHFYTLNNKLTQRRHCYCDKVMVSTVGTFQKERQAMEDQQFPLLLNL